MADMNISNKLKKARKDAGLTQKEIYDWLGINQSTFSSWETGKSEPSVFTFLQLCAKYQIEDICEYFLYDKAAPKRVLDNKMLLKLSSLPPRSLAAVYNCIDFEYSNIAMQQAGKKRTIPIYMQPAAAGLGNYLDLPDYEEAELEAPENTDAGIRISGDSMEPVIQNGEIVFVKFQPQILGDQVGIFVLNGEAYCKRLEYRAGEPYLCSFNPRYSPIRILPTDNLRVIGKVLL